MCLSLIPMTAFAYGNEWIQLDKDNYDPGDKMVVTIKSVTQKMADDQACAGWVNVKDTFNNSGLNRLREVGETVFDFQFTKHGVKPLPLGMGI